jgi:aminopeptidase-like protein
VSQGAEMHALVERLYPICRSITGDGVRQTLQAVAEHIPLQVREVPSGTAVFDWTVPQEWAIREAYIADGAGRRIVDFAESNLHVVSYSAPIDATMTLDELRPHLHTLPEQPTLTPYRTSYYSPDWGFCLPHELLEQLDPAEQYHVKIDSTLFDGHLTYAECLLPGRTPDELLFSVHVCHPSLANDNLAGIAVATWLAQELVEQDLHHTVRILFLPGTIGSITWLARNQEHVDKIKHGLVLACAGDPGPLTYKRSRRGDADIDRAVPHVLAAAGRPHKVVDFSPYGYDERQYCSPGFNLPVGCLTRTPYAGYPEYHTSADNPGFVSPEALEDTLQACRDLVSVLDRDRRYRSLNPYCEPQLGKRGLYESLGGRSDAKAAQLAMLWVQNLADGQHSLLDVAERAGLSFDAMAEAADALRDAGLIKE